MSNQNIELNIHSSREDSRVIVSTLINELTQRAILEQSRRTDCRCVLNDHAVLNYKIDQLLEINKEPVLRIKQLEFEMRILKTIVFNKN